MKYKFFLVVFVIGLISSIILSSISLNGLCKPGGSCELVNNSNYGTTFGIKNSMLGIFIFSFMIILTLFHINTPTKHTKNVIHAAVIIGAAVSLYFLYLQLFVIKLFCEYCLVVDLSLIASLILLFWFWKH